MSKSHEPEDMFFPTSILWLLRRACKKDELVALRRRLIFDCAADVRRRMSLVASVLATFASGSRPQRETKTRTWITQQDY